MLFKSRHLTAVVFLCAVITPACVSEQPGQIASYPSSAVTEKNYGSVEELVEDYRRTIAEIYNSLPSKEDQAQWASAVGHCGDVSISWLPALLEKGFSVSFEQTDVVGKIAPEGDHFDNKIHFFLADRTFGAKQEIIIDPSYLQFFQEGETLREPLIFIGTRDELQNFYGKHKQRMRLNVPEDPYTGSYDLKELISFIYSFGEYEKGRTSF